jgi:hypothetical protein
MAWDMMTIEGMWVVPVIGALLILVLVLAAAALLKYLVSGR